ncbi:MAG: hypothetical protein QOC64_2644 [Solirubrobacteraceae bacterium]|jgi:hypothetical protein|nr:hypothetical protein [Solirubrobacteraceae bacterium]
MRRQPQRPLRSLLATLSCLLVGAVCVTAASAARDQFLVPVSAGATGFGPFVERPGENGVRPLVRAFANPSSTVLQRGGASCVLRWTPLGIRAHVTNFGQPFSPCLRGIFTQARLTDRRWHTTAGIRPGSSERDARRVSKRRCTRDRCGITGYALGLHHSDCAGGLVPSVIAEVRDAKVAALRVNSRGCE